MLIKLAALQVKKEMNWEKEYSKRMLSSDLDQLDTDGLHDGRCPTNCPTCTCTVSTDYLWEQHEGTGCYHQGCYHQGCYPECCCPECCCCCIVDH